MTEEKTRIEKAYRTFTDAIATSGLEDLEQFVKFLESIENGDYGPGGELAREVKMHVEDHIAEWFPNGS